MITIVKNAGARERALEGVQSSEECRPGKGDSEDRKMPSSCS